MIESLALAAALLTADAEVRQSEAFACWCDVMRFQYAEWMHDEACAHLEWLQARKDVDSDINPTIDDLLAEQRAVIDCYRLVQIVIARPYSPDDPDRMLRVRRLIGDDDYFAGRLPAPVTCQRR